MGFWDEKIGISSDGIGISEVFAEGKTLGEHRICEPGIPSYTLLAAYHIFSMI